MIAFLSNGRVIAVAAILGLLVMVCGGLAWHRAALLADLAVSKGHLETLVAAHAETLATLARVHSDQQRAEAALAAMADQGRRRAVLTQQRQQESRYAAQQNPPRAVDPVLGRAVDSLFAPGPGG